MNESNDVVGKKTTSAYSSSSSSSSMIALFAMEPRSFMPYTLSLERGVNSNRRGAIGDPFVWRTEEG